jgi:hypothetical protein
MDAAAYAKDVQKRTTTAIEMRILKGWKGRRRERERREEREERESDCV